MQLQNKPCWDVVGPVLAVDTGLSQVFGPEMHLYAATWHQHWANTQESSLQSVSIDYILQLTL